MEQSVARSVVDDGLSLYGPDTVGTSQRPEAGGVHVNAGFLNQLLTIGTLRFGSTLGTGFEAIGFRTACGSGLDGFARPRLEARDLALRIATGRRRFFGLFGAGTVVVIAARFRFQPQLTAERVAYSHTAAFPEDVTDQPLSAGSISRPRVAFAMTQWRMYWQR